MSNYMICLKLVPIMSNETNKSIWAKVLKVTITLLSALAAALGIQACA